MHGIEPRTTEFGDRGEIMGVRRINLRVLRQVATERLDALALDAGDRDAGIGERVRDREPAHAGWLHHRLHAVALAEPGRHTGVEGRGIMAEAQRPADRLPVLEDLGDEERVDSHATGEDRGRSSRKSFRFPPGP